MAISFIGSANGTNTATMPAHVAGDFIVVAAFRFGNATSPTAPGGWTNIAQGGSGTAPNAISRQVSYKMAASSSEVVGTWTNADALVVHVYRGAAAKIGGAPTTAGTSTNANYPALTLQNNVSSWMVAFGGAIVNTTSIETPKTGTTLRQDHVGAVGELCSFDTNGPWTSAWTSQNVALGSSTTYATVAFELLESPHAVTAQGGSYTLTGANTPLIRPSPISFIGAANGTNTATLPAHVAGDLIVVVAINTTNTTAPTLISGFTTDSSIVVGSGRRQVMWKIATSSGETIPAITNCNICVAAVYRGTRQISPLANNASVTASSTSTLTYSAIAALKADGSSWVFGVGATPNTTTTIENAPLNMTLRNNPTVGSWEVAIFDTNGGVGLFSSRSVALGSSVTSYSSVVEILAPQNPVMDMVPGSYTLSAPNTTLTRNLPMPAGGYALSGADTALARALLMSGSAGSYEITGRNIQIDLGRFIYGVPGSYELSGQSTKIDVPFRAEAVHFNQSAQFTANELGASGTSLTGSVSFWIKKPDPAPDNTSETIFLIETHYNPLVGSAQVWCQLVTTGGLLVLYFTSEMESVGEEYKDLQAYVVIDPILEWTNFKINWNVTTGEEDVVIYRYDTPLDVTVGVDGDYELPIDWSVAYVDLFDVDTTFDISELWIDNSIIDFSVEANRRKFSNDHNHPVYLGGNGEQPTETPPAIYVSGPVDQFHVNRGEGVDFTRYDNLNDITPDPWTGVNAVESFYDEFAELDGTPISSVVSDRFTATFRFIIRDGGGINVLYMEGVGVEFYIIVDPDYIEVYTYDNSGNEVYFYSSFLSLTPDTWYFGAISFDASTGFHQVYVDDAAVSITVDTSNVTFNMDWSELLYTGIGQYGLGLAEVWIAPGEFIDFSVEANRRKFNDASNNPVNLGSDGSLTTGIVPAVYLKNDADTYYINSGSGPDFIETSLLSNADTSPSDWFMSPVSGSYSIEGVDVGIFLGRPMFADPGSYAFTGSDTFLATSRMLSVDPGSYVLSGADTILDISGFIYANAGSYLLSGADVEFVRSLLFSADAGVYALAGADTSFARSLIMSGAAGAYEINGVDVLFSYDYVMNGDAGAYALDGADTLFMRTMLSVQDAGSYTLSGADTPMYAARLMTLEPASYSIDGADVTMTEITISIDLNIYQDGEWNVGRLKMYRDGSWIKPPLKRYVGGGVWAAVVD